jgi:hypothetical protein
MISSEKMTTFNMYILLEKMALIHITVFGAHLPYILGYNWILFWGNVYCFRKEFQARGTMQNH